MTSASERGRSPPGKEGKSQAAGNLVPLGATTVVLMDDRERSRILSTARLKVILSVFVVALLLGLGSLAF